MECVMATLGRLQSAAGQRASDTLEPKLLQQGGKARDGLMRAVKGKSYLPAIQRELRFPD